LIRVVSRPGVFFFFFFRLSQLGVYIDR